EIREAGGRHGEHIEANWLLTRGLGKQLLAGQRACSQAPTDVAHSWKSIVDAARTLVTAATDERALGRAWHVPTNPALTIRQLAERFCEVNGAPPAKLTALPYPVLWTAGLFSPMIRELRTTRYQFTSPLVLDSTATADPFDLHPRPLEDALRDAAAGLRAPATSRPA